MNYWLDLFTGTTWDEFRQHGATVTGFRPRMRNYMRAVRPGDILLCYLTGVMRWVGALEVLGESDDTTRIWKGAEFPVRFRVKPLIALDAEYGLPMSELEGRVDFYASSEHAGKFKGFVRRSPNKFKRPADGELILQLLRELERNPVERDVDEGKLYPKRLYEARRKKGRGTIATVVSVPDAAENDEDDVSTGEETSALLLAT